MKNVIAILCFVFASSFAFAQGTLEEVVYLKNGSIIHGTIVEFVPNVSIKVKSGPNLFAYKIDEIEKITREEIKGGGAGFETKTKGYYGIAQIGFTDIATGGHLPMFSMSIINGYQFNRYFSLGGGIGADLSGANTYNVPVFLDARVNFLKTKVTPFFALGFGYNMQIAQALDYYSYNTSTQVYHGMVFNPAIGVKGFVSKKIALSFAVGYKMIGAKYTSYDYYSGTISTFGISHGFNAMFGVHF